MHELRQVLKGRLVTPDDPDWEQVRRGWNLSVDQQPAAVVEASGPNDIEFTIAYAGARGLKVAAQAGGHGATRALDGTIVVRTSALDDISVDSQARIARLGAGVRWGTVQAALDGTGSPDCLERAATSRWPASARVVGSRGSRGRTGAVRAVCGLRRSSTVPGSADGSTTRLTRT
ncbi:FAD-binding oxidoreductase [Kribbella jiaozuonensis]|uniref:FAD-dependent oxidoreductase n=1 Tax=Kribbella jiaozuonensis TaxID=2575441 RepID=A0A4U3LFV8_9ACTN|nr:FAD-binding protein [Kribbella jiaozuonensis]TKK74418.1 FAD-dependent oxidoreductase [Kribbella jiaozuonensis]